MEQNRIAHLQNPPNRGRAELRYVAQSASADARSVLEHLGVAALFVRRDTHSLGYATQAGGEFFGVRPSDLVGTSILDRTAEPAVLRDLIAEATDDGSAPARALRFSIGGLPKPAYVSVCALPGDDPPTVAVFIMPLLAGDSSAAEPHRPAIELGRDSGFPGILGKSPAIRRVCRLVGKVAKTDSTVLLQGESGTGKEIFARAIHRHSERARGPFVRVNCAALSEGLLESELFGHVRGAFTGAVRSRDGRFRASHGGTILLDEVGSMSMAGQSKLLRVLQEREFEPVGSTRTTQIDVRVIATTNVDLREASRSGAFREDLFYRLSVISVYLPPLRERPSDIPLLADAVAKRVSRQLGKQLLGFSPQAIEELLRHDWPGNVRELENVIERAVVVEEGEVIQSASLGLSPASRAGDPAPKKKAPLGLRERLDIVERQIVLQTLWKANWVKKQAALELGIDPRNLSYFLKKHGIEKEDRALDEH